MSDYPGLLSGLMASQDTVLLSQPSRVLREDQIEEMTRTQLSSARHYVARLLERIERQIASVDGVAASDHQRPDASRDDVRLRAQKVRGAIHGQREDADLRRRVEATQY